MNNQTANQFIEKIKEAKRLEMEAIMLLVPSDVKPHLEVIGKEIKAIVMETIVNIMKNQGEEASEKDQTERQSKTNKVNIE